MEIPREFSRLLDNDWREAAVYGSRFSLKSGTVARILLIRARQTRRRIGCFREFQNSIAESSHQLLKDLIELYDLTDFEVTDNAIINTVNGSDFLFKGLHRNDQSIKSIEGLDIAWVEEAQTVSQKSLEVLTPTIRKEGSQIIYTYNRLFDEDPVHKRLVLEGRPNTLIIKTDYTIAEKYGYLPVTIKDEIEDDKKRPNLFKHKWLGEPESALEGKIYQGWMEIEDVPEEARLERKWLDFGYSIDPSAIGRLYKWNDAFVLDEDLYQKGLSNKQLAEFLLYLPNPKILTIADSAEPKSVDEIRSFGINILPSQKGPDSVRQGIQVVQDQKIFVTRRSVNIWKEYRNYVWLIDKDGKIINQEDPRCANHHMSGIRYAICSIIPLIRKKELRRQMGMDAWDRIHSTRRNMV